MQPREFFSLPSTPAKALAVALFSRVPRKKKKRKKDKRTFSATKKTAMKREFKNIPAKKEGVGKRRSTKQQNRRKL